MCNPAVVLVGIYSRETKLTFTQAPVHKCLWKLSVKTNKIYLKSLVEINI